MSAKVKAFVGFVIAVTLIALPFVRMALAHADTTDDAFVAALRMDGIGVTSSASSLIGLGHEICHAASKGLSDNQIATAIEGPDDYSFAQAFYMIGAAEAAYCPVYASRSVNDTGGA